MKDQLHEVGIQMLCGGGASAIGKTVLAPIERIKIILQTQSMLNKSFGHRPFEGLFSGIHRISSDQGIAALWRGNFANCLRIVPTYAMRFTLFDRFRDFMTPKDCSSLADLSLFRQMMAGGLSGFSTMLATYPLDLARTRLAADVRRRDATRTLVGMLLKTKRAEGVTGLYKGVCISLVEIAPYVAISLGGYEFLKAQLLPSLLNDDLAKPEDLAFRRTAFSLGCGWFSGLCASLVCYPMDTIKRQLMLDGNSRGNVVWSRKYKGKIRNCFRSLYKQGNMQGRVLAPFYAGCFINAMKSSPAAAITFVANDWLRDLFNIN
eukprot:GSMAST32.ASY1.ANO1.1438.1 assembled CDS